MCSTLNFYGVLCRLFAASSSFGHVNVMILVIFSCLRIQQNRSIHEGRSLNWILKEWRYIDRGLSYYRIWCNDGSSMLSMTNIWGPVLSRNFFAELELACEWPKTTVSRDVTLWQSTRLHGVTSQKTVVFWKFLDCLNNSELLEEFTVP